MRRAIACALALGLSACTVGPDFVPPKAPSIASWRDPSAHRTRAPVTPQSNPDPAWWQGFHDPVLTRLINRAISGNLDLQQAVLRVVESRQGEVAARAAGLPSVNGSGSYMREQLGLRGLLLSQGTYGQAEALGAPGSPLNTFSPGLGTRAASSIIGALNQFGQPVNLFQYGLNSSWELDLFGRVRRSEEQARASTEAQIEATNDALVMLEGQVAQAYIQLRGAQALTTSQVQNIRVAQEAYDLTRMRQRQGLTTELDVDQATTQLANFQSQLPGYEKQSEQAMNRLSVLVGEPPGTLDATLGRVAPLPKLPAVIGIGIPSTLARRRPDIRQAEAQLHAATANVGVATASFYPDVSLTGSFGLRALDGAYLTNWASSFYSFGPSISLPIFQGGQLTANLRLARAQEAQAALAYRSTVLNALQEVEDALVAYRTDRAARNRIRVAVKSAQTTQYLARDRYSHGLADFIEVLDAQRTLTATRQQLVQADVALSNDVVGLYNALGGGWQEDSADINAPAVATRPPVVPAALDSVAATPPQ
ncbi:efflux transporter outer membrane subunit [Rhodopila globiformis]|uniref:RND transporter n=1 Tax=Rhodopila globiformis TaxID=1071 RepID=A0A2S6MU40_RHOGL|nr:efflux transporter outer membrane subunit [Rhodopila globiformis]PPQ25875.1 RND transporter [Rhodopila globiformis]